MKKSGFRNSGFSVDTPVPPEQNSRGLRCPKCGCGHFRVIYTRSGGGKLIRRPESVLRSFSEGGYTGIAASDSQLGRRKSGGDVVTCRQPGEVRSPEDML